MSEVIRLARLILLFVVFIVTSRVQLLNDSQDDSNFPYGKMIPFYRGVSSYLRQLLS